MRAENIRAEIHISGRVQHVGYRNFAKNAAHRLGITGYAKNLTDGRVFVLAEGKSEALKLFTETLNKGPLFADVEKVDLIFKNPTGEFEDFFRY
ncbi:MAG: acylphosphatase [Methanosarcinaceae archaeon]|nr:acylphosphatase [Methanosarcinaceae archaeon]